MKSKTKKLFLSLFAFASLAITACSGGGTNSSSGGSASGDTSSETSGGSQSSEDSSTPTQVTKLFVSVDDQEEELTYSSGSYSIGPVELEADQVLKIYTKDASDTPVSILDDVSVETASFADWFEVGEGQVTVKVSGTYSFEFEVDGEDYNLTVEKEGVVTTYHATLTEGSYDSRTILVHAFSNTAGASDYTAEVSGQKITFTVDNPAYDKFIVCKLKEGETTLGDKWVNVDRQSDNLTLQDNVNFTWKPSADDNYHLWGSTDGTNWGELGKFTLNESVYSATVTLAKDTEFVFHLEAYSTLDSGWRNFTDLVGSGVSGNFKAKGGEGDDKNNIIVETGGEYTFTVTNEHKIQVGGAAPTPTPSTDYYIRGAAVGSWDVAEANKLLAPLAETQIGYISNIHFDVGEFVIANNDYSHKWGYYWDHGSGNVKNIIGEASDNFSEGASDNNIKCDVAGNYDVYLMTNDYISIVLHGEPIPTNVTTLTINDVNIPIEALDPSTDWASDQTAKYRATGVSVEAGQILDILVDDTPVLTTKRGVDADDMDHHIKNNAALNTGVYTIRKNNASVDVYINVYESGWHSVWVSGGPEILIDTVTVTVNQSPVKGANVLAHLWVDGGEEGTDVQATYEGTTVTFELEQGYPYNRVILAELKPGATTYGEAWANVQRQTGTATITAGAATATWDGLAKYYVTGSMLTAPWHVDANYEFSINPGNASEYLFAGIELKKDDQIKVISSENGSDVATWYPDGMDNAYVVPADGTYDIYFKPSGGVEGWHSGYFYVAVAS